MTPRELFVGADHPAAFRTIGEALAVAADRDEIHVLPGEYRESLVIDKTVRIGGDGPRDRIIIRPLISGEPCLSIRGGDPYLHDLTIDGSEFDRVDPDGADPIAQLSIAAGSPLIEAIHIYGAGGIWIGGAATSGEITAVRDP